MLFKNDHDILIIKITIQINNNNNHARIDTDLSINYNKKRCGFDYQSKESLLEHLKKEHLKNEHLNLEKDEHMIVYFVCKNCYKIGPWASLRWDQTNFIDFEGCEPFGGQW